MCKVLSFGVNEAVSVNGMMEVKVWWKIEEFFLVDGRCGWVEGDENFSVWTIVYLGWHGSTFSNNRTERNFRLESRWIADKHMINHKPFL